MSVKKCNYKLYIKRWERGDERGENKIMFRISRTSKNARYRDTFILFKKKLWQKCTYFLHNIKFCKCVSHCRLKLRYMIIERSYKNYLRFINRRAVYHFYEFNYISWIKYILKKLHINYIYNKIQFSIINKWKYHFYEFNYFS